MGDSGNGLECAGVCGLLAYDGVREPEYLVALY